MRCDVNVMPADINNRQSISSTNDALHFLFNSSCIHLYQYFFIFEKNNASDEWIPWLDGSQRFLFLIKNNIFILKSRYLIIYIYTFIIISFYFISFTIKTT